MSKELPVFVAKGVLFFLTLEILLFPLREYIIGAFARLLPPGYRPDWACTGIDEILLYTSFLLAYPSDKPKARYIILGVILLEVFNLLRIAAIVMSGSIFLHDVLFRWGGFLLTVGMFFVAFRALSFRR